MTEKKKDLGDRKQPPAKTPQKASKSPMSVSSQNSFKNQSPASQKSTFHGRPSFSSKPAGAKSFVPPVSQSKLLSSRAQRDAQSDKGHDGHEGNEQKSDSPLGTPDRAVSMASLGDGRSALKSMQGGLVSIEEQVDE